MSKYLEPPLVHWYVKRDRWDDHFLGMALHNSRMSKDPATRVGCIIVGHEHEIVSGGFNGFPRGIADDHRLCNRADKLRLIVHAEMNAVLAAAKLGTRLKDCTLYIACTDESGFVWGGPPCTRCSVEIIQAGITQVVSYPQKEISKWKEDLDEAKKILSEAGVGYRERNAFTITVSKSPPVRITPSLEEYEKLRRGLYGVGATVGDVTQITTMYGPPSPAESFDYGSSG